MAMTMPGRPSDRPSARPQDTATCIPVPHRHFTFGIPKMLRPYFRFDRDLLKDQSAGQWVKVNLQVK